MDGVIRSDEAPRLREGAFLRVAIIGIIAIGAAFAADAPVQAFLQVHLSPGFIQAGRLISEYGAWTWLMARCLGGLITAGLARSRRWIVILAAAMIASSVAGVTADMTRALTGRTRPWAAAPQGWYGPSHDGRSLIGKTEFNAFPSGHTSSAAGLAAVLWLASRRMRIPAVLIAGSVGAARLAVNAHHLSDVVAGGLLGTLVGLWVWDRMQRRFAGG